MNTSSPELTHCSRVFPEKLTVPQLVKKFPVFYVTRTFITALTRAYHLSLFWAKPIQTVTNFLKIHVNIILLSIPMSSKRSLSLRCSYQNPVRIFSVSQKCHLPRQSHSSWFGNPNNKWQEELVIKLPFTINCVFFMPSTSNEAVCDFSEEDGRFAGCLSLTVLKTNPFF